MGWRCAFCLLRPWSGRLEVIGLPLLSTFRLRNVSNEAFQQLGQFCGSFFEAPLSSSRALCRNFGIDLLHKANGKAIRVGSPGLTPYDGKEDGMGGACSKIKFQPQDFRSGKRLPER